MQQVERLLKKIIKDFNDPDAYWTYGFEKLSTSKKGDYRAMIKFSKDSVKPLVFGANTEDALIAQIKHFDQSDDPRDINVSFHHSQIEIQKEIMTFHEQQLRKYENR